MVSYHLFLIWLVMTSEEESGLSFNIPTTVLAHIICIFIVVAVRVIFAVALRWFIHADPALALILFAFYGTKLITIVQFLITCTITLFERDWLFSAGKRRPQVVKVETKVPPAPVATLKAIIEPPAPLVGATGEDHAAWVKERSSAKNAYYKPGSSPGDDFEKWLRARGKTQYPKPVPDSPPLGTTPAEG
jgi:hypothetical protein